MAFERGTVIAGKYRVERVIGQGGMGVVLAARHLGLDEMVAVKLIREERADGAAALARFQREARAAARIKSEHVARVLDVDRLPEGEPYIVMELIDGTDLHALVKRRGTLAPDEAVTYITQACEGLAEAHALGMVHRDLKLKNLFLTKRRDGRALIKVIDFGVVKLSPLGDDDELTLDGSPSQLGRTKAREATLTGAAVLVGSVHYMAPEQIRASNVVNAQADVWSLGVCLYAMLTGSLPFEGETIAAVCAAIQGRPAPDVRLLAPHVPAAIADAVGRALEKDVGRRFADVAELASAIAPLGSDRAAPSRIETILRSNLRERPLALAPAEEPEHGATATSDAVLPGRAESTAADALHGRVESTIDAAAVGSIAPRPVGAGSTGLRRRWLQGALVAVLAAGATVAIWGRPATRSRADADARSAGLLGADSSAQSAERARPASSNAPLPRPETVPVPANAADAPALAPADLADAPVARPAGARPAPKRAPHPSKVTTAPPKATTAPPKAEPSNAYDHF
ncbi:MAG: protein kinase [Labilithrix sp.]|nr:protein kinase [Labilithrix sp.]